MELETVDEEIARLYREGVSEVEIVRRMNVKRYIVRNAITFEKGRQAGLAQARDEVLAGVVTISKAAEMLKISRQMAHRMVNSGRLDSWRLESAGDDRPVVVDRAQVKALVEKRAQEILVTVP